MIARAYKILEYKYKIDITTYPQSKIRQQPHKIYFQLEQQQFNSCCQTLNMLDTKSIFILLILKNIYITCFYVISS